MFAIRCGQPLLIYVAFKATGKKRCNENGLSQSMLIIVFLTGLLNAFFISFSAIFVFVA
jgi:hypothetical protein